MISTPHIEFVQPNGQMYSNVSNVSNVQTKHKSSQVHMVWYGRYVNRFPTWFCQGACPNGPGARFEQRGLHVCPSSWTRRSQNYFGWLVLESSTSAGRACGYTLLNTVYYGVLMLRPSGGVGQYRSCWLAHLKEKARTLKRMLPIEIITFMNFTLKTPGKLRPYLE